MTQIIDRPTASRTIWRSLTGEWLDALVTGQAMRSGRPALGTTVRTYRIAIEQLGEFLQERGMPTDPVNVSREHLLEWMRHMRAPASEGGQGLTEQTVLQRYRGVSRFFTWLIDEDEITTHPMAKMKPPSPDQKLVPVVPEEALKKLFKVTAGREFEDRRDRALLSVFVDVGPRISEVAGITLADLDTENREIRILGKGGRFRILRYNRDTAGDLNRYLRARLRHPKAEASNALWLGRRGRVTGSGIYRAIQRRCEDANVPPIHPHQLRHTFAHMYLKGGGDSGNLMRVAGWRSPSMVLRYGASVAEERARDAHDHFSPRQGLT